MSEENLTTRDERQAKRKDFLQVVSFSLGKEEYAIEITKVKEIILPKGITHVPQMPDYIEGLINLRGNVIPVVDLRKRFGLVCDTETEHTRIMVTRMESKIVGLIVDSVSQVMKIPNAQIQEPPETIAGLARDYLMGIGKLDDRMIILLDIEKIMNAGEKEKLFVASQQILEQPADSSA